MRDAILNFNKQFEFEPQIENEKNLQKRDIFLVAGMGGSHWGADIIQSLDPTIDIVINSDYDLSSFGDSVLENALIIANSYSGNTEETIAVFNEGQRRGLSLAAISIGGKLADLARDNAIPYIRVPDTGIQPRSALGFSVKAMLKMMGQDQLLNESKALSQKLNPTSAEEQGKSLAEILRGKVPVIYSSTRNRSAAFIWKIKFNETGKIPAFANVFPELNHNEMTGFDVSAASGSAYGGKDVTKPLSENFHFIFLRDLKDHPKILKRMEITKKLYRDRGLPVTVLEMKGESKIEKIFSSLILADWAAYYTAENYGVESEQVPMVEEFKRLVSSI